MQRIFNPSNFWLLHLICLVLCVVVSALDYITGFDLSFFMFYTLPILVATWYMGLRLGIAYALIAMIGWSVATYYTDHSYQHPLIPFWNGGMRLAFFIFSAYGLNALSEKIKLEEYNADYDVLTGLLNARGFYERAELIFSLLTRKNETFALAYIDIDNFKSVNDTMGHHEGDHILQVTGKIMKASFRASDLICRMGGDEFVIMLPRLSEEDLHKSLQNFKLKLDETALEHNWPIGYSIGACLFESGATTLSDAVQSADVLMYKVKKSGKGRITIENHTEPASRLQSQI